MKFNSKIAGIVLIVLLSACNQQKKSKQESSEAVKKEGTTDFSIPETWVNRRVDKTKNELATSDAGRVIWAAMEAHGGLKTWFSNGALSLRFNYVPLAEGSTNRETFQVLDLWRNKAVHTSTTDSEATYGWDGSTAWVKTKDSTAFAYDTKFWALTPLYLFGHPFVIDGEGVNLELLPETSYKGKTNDVVKVTFSAGTGDAPDDYYILQFDKESHLLTATRYIVSYPAYFKDGGHNPEKFMEVGELINVNGVLLPNGLKTHMTAENGQPGEYVTKIEISDMKFTKDLTDDFFDVPKGSKIIE